LDPFEFNEELGGVSIGLKDPIQNWLKILNLSQQNVDKKGLVKGEETKGHKVTIKETNKGDNLVRN
jgi:hypothetical protein